MKAFKEKKVVTLTEEETNDWLQNPLTEALLECVQDFNKSVNPYESHIFIGVTYNKVKKNTSTLTFQVTSDE